MIDLSMTPLRAELIQAVASFAAKEFPPSGGVEAALRGGAAIDPERWTRLAGMGVFSLGISEDAGGLGLGSLDELYTVLELGRAAASGPIIGTMLAARAAEAAGDGSLLESLTSGATRAGIVAQDYVVDSGAGDLAVKVDASGLHVIEVTDIEPLVSSDPLATVGALRASRTVLTVDDIAALPRMRLLVAGYLSGLAAASVEMATEYAKLREQFGRPIGSFQAVKHRCAEMVIRSYPLQAQLGIGAFLLENNPAAGHLEIAEGLLMAIDAAGRNVEDNVQTHGGIGFTTEHPAGVLVKRVISHRQLAGSVDDLVADILAISRTRPS